MEDQRDEIKQKIDIVDLINEYVPLKKRGSNYIGLCPFHNEKTPSFTVNPRGGFYHCFGCGKGGDIFTFIMDMENIEFREALEILAGRAGVTLKKFNFNYEKPEEKNLKEKLLEVNELSKEYFKQSLYKVEAKEAQEYIRKRKMNKESLKNFDIGYSDGKVYDFLKRKGYLDKEIIESGVCYKRDDGKIIDRFFRRIIFPIKDIRGNVIAFSGRNIEKNSKYAKYINTSDTLIYNKGNHLFGLNLAKKYAKDQLIIVEGNMDVISLHQSGVKNVVAGLGTALTEMQANLLKSRTKEVLICYDSDEAGVKAALRAIDILENKKITVRVVKLGDVKDPDEFILKYGMTAFNLRIKEAESGTIFKIENIKKNINTNTPEGKVEFLKQLSKIISEIPNRLEQEVYVNEISKKYRISNEAIMQEVNKFIRKKRDENFKIKNQKNLMYNVSKEKNNYNKNNIELGLDIKNNNKEKLKKVNEKREELVIYLLIFYRKFIEKFNDENILEYILNIENKKTIKYILDQYQKYGEDININNILSNTKDNEIIKKITKIGMNEIENFKEDEAYLDVINVFKNQKISNEKEKITKRLNELSLLTEITEEEKEANKREKLELMKKLSKLMSDSKK